MDETLIYVLDVFTDEIKFLRLPFSYIEIFILFSAVSIFNELPKSLSKYEISVIKETGISSITK